MRKLVMPRRRRVRASGVAQDLEIGRAVIRESHKLRKARLRWIELLLRAEIELGSRGNDGADANTDNRYNKIGIVIWARGSLHGYGCRLRKWTILRRSP